MKSPVLFPETTQAAYDFLSLNNLLKDSDTVCLEGDDTGKVEIICRIDGSTTYYNVSLDLLKQCFDLIEEDESIASFDSGVCDRNCDALAIVWYKAEATAKLELF